MNAPFTTQGLRRGIRDGLPLGLSIFIYGLAFGLVAAQAMLSVPQSMMMSAAVYSGSAQLAALSLIGSGTATLTALAATILVMNARYLLFGAALRPWLGAATPAQAYGSLLMLGDANWVLTMKRISEGEQDRAFLAGAGIPMFVGWLTGTWIGVVSGNALPDPRLLGADLMLPAFAAAMMAMMMKGPTALLPVITGALAAVVAERLAGPGAAIVAAGLAGGALAAIMAKSA